MEATPEALFDAIDDGDVSAVIALLESDRALVAARDEGGLTPLLRAAIGLTRDAALLEALLSAGADPRATTDEGETALHLVIDVEGEAGFGAEPLELMRPLVAAGANLEAEQSDGLTPLALAVVHGTPDEVAALVALGAAVDRRLSDDPTLGPIAGRTLLGAALGSPEKVAALAAAGADPTDADGRGSSALQLARSLESEARAAGEGDFAEALARSARALTSEAGRGPARSDSQR